MTEGINWLYENTDGEYADAVPFVPLDFQGGQKYNHISTDV